MSIPTKLNGHPVIAFNLHTNGYATVMVEKPGEYVVATWWPELGKSWSWGHYHQAPIGDVDAYNRAQDDFAETAKRNSAR